MHSLTNLNAHFIEWNIPLTVKQHNNNFQILLTCFYVKFMLSSNVTGFFVFYITACLFAFKIKATYI